MRTVAAVLLATCLAGCAGLGPKHADRYYLLDGGPGHAASQRAASVRTTATTAASFYDTQDIAFSRAQGMRSHYHFNHWTERPERAVHEQLAARFDRPAGDDAYVLSTHVSEIYHDAVQSPGVARITIAAELSAPDGRTTIARRTFTRSAPAATYDAGGAVVGFNQALGEVLDDIVGWVDAQVPATSAREATARR